MLQLLKREFYLSRVYFLFIFFYPILLGEVYPLLTFIWVAGFVFTSFNYDSKNYVNRFIISMPIKKVNIVLARYLYITLTYILTVIHLLLAGKFLILSSLKLATYPDSPELLSILFGIFLSISIPIFYLFQSYAKAFLIQMLLIFIGTIAYVTFVENPHVYESVLIRTIVNIIEIQPYVIPAAFLLLCLCISYKFSAWIFVKNDVI